MVAKGALLMPKIKTYGTALTPGDVYLGIDQSYTGFGMTAIAPDGSFTTAVLSTESKDYDHNIDRLVEIRRFIFDFINGNIPPKTFFLKEVAMEGYAYSSTMGHKSGELGGMVKMVLLDLGLYPILVPPATLKKYVTGKGTGVQKNQILLHTYKKWDVEFSDDNAADSYGLARIAAGMSGTSYEKEVLKTLSDPKFKA